MASDASVREGSRLTRLLGYLEKDPANPALLADAAQAAFDEGDYALSSGLIVRHPAPAPPALLNLEGLIALAQHRFVDAAAIFEALRHNSDDAALRFNLAWAKAMSGGWQEALGLLDDAVLAASPRAPALKIHVMHHLEMYEDALAEGGRLAERFPNNQELMGTLATLALDADRPDLAKHYAAAGGDNPDARTALGLLLLDEQDSAQSLVLFDEAMRRQPNNPRAWLGRGLAQLARGEARAGSEAIDRAAELFHSHIGSWVASGWAHFINGEIAKSRDSFERAIAIDANFAESHGGLAVVDLAQGRLDDARRECEIALRLDKACFGGALAKSLLLERGGHPLAAQRILEAAMSAPIGPSGKTIVQALAGFGMSAR